MKMRWIGLCIVLAVVVACGTSLQWVEFSPEGGGFTISVPGVAEENRQSVDTIVGTLEVVTYLVDTEPVGYFVGYLDVPQVALQDGPDALIDGGRTGAIGNLEGSTLISESDLTVEGYPANEFVASFTLEGKADAGIAKGRYILVGTRLYQVFVLAKKDAGQSEEIDRFISSFELVK